MPLSCLFRKIKILKIRMPRRRTAAPPRLVFPHKIGKTFESSSGNVYLCSRIILITKIT